MNKRIHHIITIALPGIVLLGLSAVFLLSPLNKYSDTERRTLAEKPEVTGATLASGEFMSDFETYTQDQFPLRDSFRTVKAAFSHYVLRQKDKNGLYLSDGYLSKLEYPENTAKTDASLKKLREVYDRSIKGTDCHTYMCIIPDKNYYLAPVGGYPVMDYEAVFRKFESGLPNFTFIDITNLLSLESFYLTDQHWRQEKLIPIANELAYTMNTPLSAEFGDTLSDTANQTLFTDNVSDTPFYGTYCGQAMLPAGPDTIHYLTNEAIEGCRVTNYDTGAPVEAKVYNMDKASGRDPYEMFLEGSTALLTIENDHALTDKELVVFRDSFGSSLSPLLVSGYRKITLVDLRYIQSDMLKFFVKFENQDVLYLYSTLILNNTMSK